MKTDLHCQSFGLHGIFLYFLTISAICGDLGIRYPKLTQKLVMSMTNISGGQKEQTIYSVRVSDIKILGNKVVIPIMSLINKLRQQNTFHTCVFRLTTRSQGFGL